MKIKNNLFHSIFIIILLIGCTKQNPGILQNSTTKQQSQNAKEIQWQTIFVSVYNADLEEKELREMKVKIWYEELSDPFNWQFQWRNENNLRLYNRQNNSQSVCYNVEVAQEFDVIPAIYNPITKEISFDIQKNKIAFIEFEYLPNYIPNQQFLEWYYLSIYNSRLQPNSNHYTIYHYYDCP